MVFLLYYNLGLVDAPIQMAALSSIGDKTSAYIRIETDYILPDTFNPETDYILPLNIRTNISPMLNGYGSEFMCFKEDGVTYYLTCVEISPISIRMGAFRMPQNRQKAQPGSWLEEIHFEDGTILYVEDDSDGGLRNGMFAESYVNARELGNAIEPNTVESIIICGKKIKLS